MPLRSVALASTPKTRAARHSLPASLPNSNVAGSPENAKRSVDKRGARVHFSKEDPVAETTSPLVDEMVHQLQKQLNDREYRVAQLEAIVSAWEAEEPEGSVDMLMQLQAQVLERDHHIAQLEAQILEYEQTLDKREDQHRRDLEERDIFGLKELEERDQQYQRGIEERDELYRKDLEDRERQYQQDLQELRVLIEDTKHGAQQQGVMQSLAGSDLGTTRREGDVLGHLDGIAASSDTTCDTLSQEGEKSDQLLELQKAAVTREAYIVDIERNFEELQRIAESSAARLREMEAKIAAERLVGEDLNVTRRPSAGQHVSEMEDRLGKLLELAAARISELEGQQGIQKSDATVSGVDLAREAREVQSAAASRASRIVQLENQESRQQDGSEAAADSDNQTVCGSFATTVPELESWHMEMSAPAVRAGVVSASNANALAISSENSTECTAPKLSTKQIGSPPPKLAPFPRKSAAHVQPTGGSSQIATGSSVVKTMSPRINVAECLTTRREISPPRQVPLQNVARKELSPVRIGGSVLCTPASQQRCRREASPVRYNAAPVCIPTPDTSNRVRELSPIGVASAMRELSPVHAGRSIVPASRPSLYHAAAASQPGSMLLPAALPQANAAAPSSSKLASQLGSMMVSAPTAPAMEALTQGVQLAYNGGYNPRSFSPPRAQGSQTVAHAQPSGVSAPAVTLAPKTGIDGSSVQVAPGVLSVRENTTTSSVGHTDTKETKDADKKAAHRILHL